MRTMSLILACAFLVVGAAGAGSSEGGMPGVGTFNYLDATVPVASGAPDDVSPLACAVK